MSKEKKLFMFDLGDEVKEKVTGFTGIVMAQVRYATGCMQLGVCSKELHEGKLIDWLYTDQERFEATGGHIDLAAPVGGPQDHPSRQ